MDLLFINQKKKIKRSFNASFLNTIKNYAIITPIGGIYMFSTKNRIITAISIILFITLLSIFALIPIEEKHAVSIWMKDVDDNTLITTMSIPGTHDSGATHSIFDVAGKCQDTTIKQQLELGVRFLDLRLQLVNNEFKIVHSFVDQKQKLKSVLKDISTFIKEYNTCLLLFLIMTSWLL